MMMMMSWLLSQNLLLELCLKMAKYFGNDGSVKYLPRCTFGAWTLAWALMTVGKLVLDKTSSIDFRALASIKIDISFPL